MYALLLKLTSRQARLPCKAKASVQASTSLSAAVKLQENTV